MQSDPHGHATEMSGDHSVPVNLGRGEQRGEEGVVSLVHGRRAGEERCDVALTK